MQFNSGTTETDFDHNPIEESEFLFIYDQSLIGDVQLGVLFDDSRRLKETYFLDD